MPHQSVRCIRSQFSNGGRQFQYYWHHLLFSSTAIWRACFHHQQGITHVRWLFVLLQAVRLLKLELLKINTVNFSSSTALGTWGRLGCMAVYVTDSVGLEIASRLNDCLDSVCGRYSRHFVLWVLPARRYASDSNVFVCPSRASIMSKRR